jgi:polar amino acid transport system ATP-binding protein
MDPEVILFDEPTSALDPTMVGEVEAVIKDLSTSGKTLMIVTHEMRFARSICNRVFYMDEGGIYDDGTPEEIFDHPEKENTRRFIRQLKVMELMIESHNFDFLGENAEIDRFCSRHQIPPKMALRIRSAIEELVQMILLPTLKKPKIHVTIEYSEEEEKTIGTIRYNGPVFDPANSGDPFAWPILQRSVSSISHRPIRDGEYTNEVLMEQIIE